MSRYWSLPYPSSRYPILADQAVATSQPLAAQAGLRMLQEGGNAVDAAIATAVSLTVLEPTSNGIGGDAFVLVWDGQQVHGLNASGRSPARLDAAPLLQAAEMPLRGWDTVTVPGAVSAWVALWDRFGTLPFATLFQPAITYASHGYPVGPVTAAAWARAADTLGGFPDFAATFLPGGRPPDPGERVVLPHHAETLAAIADTHGEDFYRGGLARRIAAHARDGGSALTEEDLAAHEPEWVSPLSLPYRDVVVHELPPNGQGIAALAALGILARCAGADSDPDTAEGMHWRVEAMKLAFADAHRHVADPRWMEVDPTALLDDRHLTELAGRIDPRQVADPDHGASTGGGTVYLATADNRGQAVSFIQSNFHGFGSGIVVPGTGVALHNRAAGFCTMRGHPNAVGAGKRPFHTIIPAIVTGQDGPTVLGVMGGAMQPQGHVQVIDRLCRGQNPQAAVDAPRWRVAPAGRLAVEPAVGPDIQESLARRGHLLEASVAMGGFGGAQVIQRRGACWVAASDPRKEGQAVGC